VRPRDFAADKGGDIKEAIMTGKMKLYIGLLVLGLVVIGTGVWLLFHPAPAVDAPEISENISYQYLVPEGIPVISENVSHVMRGEFNFLSIYEGGEIIYIEEKGLRMPSPEYPPTRTWNTGQLQEEELDSLLEFIKKSGFEELEDGYKFPGVGSLDTGLRKGDMHSTTVVNWEDLHKTVGASSYLTTDKGMTYPDMPYPLNELHKVLWQIAEGRTLEVARETIESSLLWK